MTVEELETQAMRLAPEQRAELVERLRASLEPGIDPATERAWLEEARRRLELFDKDKSRAIPAEEVFREARRRLFCSTNVSRPLQRCPRTIRRSRSLRDS